MGYGGLTFLTGFKNMKCLEARLLQWRPTENMIPFLTDLAKELQEKNFGKEPSGQELMQKMAGYLAEFRGWNFKNDQ
jgi:hypothetical protein